MTANDDPTALVPCARSSAMVANLLPSAVAVAAIRGAADAQTLHAEERAAGRAFAPKRLAEYAGGRFAARVALASLGVADYPLLRSSDGQPRWPPGITGSITHTEDFCAAAVAGRDRCRSIGIDAERMGRVNEDLWPLLFRAEEIAALRRLPRERRSAAATLCFSAKEAYYKYQFPLTAAWLDFTDVAIDVDGDVRAAGTFRVSAAGDAGGARAGATGRYAFDGPLVVTAITGPGDLRTFSERSPDRLGNTSTSPGPGDTR
jgi:4'-phosphopantetheinyl transferase EntD